MLISLYNIENYKGFFIDLYPLLVFKIELEKRPVSMLNK